MKDWGCGLREKHSIKTHGLFQTDESMVTIRAVRHPTLNFITRHGRYLGEVDVVRDEVISLEVPRFNGIPANTIYFQADGAGRLRFYGMVKNKQWNISAKGVPSRRITDFHDLSAERLQRIRERKGRHG